jgi:hypothetical protein
MAEKLNQDIMGRIIQYSGDRIVLWLLRNYIDPVLYREILLHKRRLLIYGQVQSGKTAAIIDAVQNTIYLGIHKIIVIQNSLLVLKQYEQRLCDANIEYQLIDPKTQQIDKEVILLINNKARYARFLKWFHHRVEDVPTRKFDKYILLMDESDSYYKGTHPLAKDAIHEYYVTATPSHRLYKMPGFFHTIKNVPVFSEYKGLNNVTIEYNNSSITEIVEQFYQEVDEGMLLVNAYKRVKEMIEIGRILSMQFRSVVFIILTSQRRITFRGEHKNLKTESISTLIDSLKDAKHVVFIANRMSLRGLSYCSTDYNRHLTHQYSDLTSGTIANSLQRMRIFGKYTDDTPIKLILPSNNKVVIDSMFNSLNLKFEICREFTL